MFSSPYKQTHIYVYKKVCFALDITYMHGLVVSVPVSDEGVSGFNPRHSKDI